MTTTTLALAAAASSPSQASRGPALLVEADPAGGDLACWCGPQGEPGLLRVATGGRRNGRVNGWQDVGAVVDVVSGVPAVLAPTSRAAASAALRSADWLARSLAHVEGRVMVDAGRWFPDSPDHCHGLVEEASLIAVVCRPALASVEHAQGLVAAVTRRSRAPVVVVLVGDSGPYAPQDVATSTGVPVAGVLPWHPRGVARLVDQGLGSGWSRSRLAGAAEGVLGTLSHLAVASGEVVYG